MLANIGRKIVDPMHKRNSAHATSLAEKTAFEIQIMSAGKSGAHNIKWDGDRDMPLNTITKVFRLTSHAISRHSVPIIQS